MFPLVFLSTTKSLIHGTSNLVVTPLEDPGSVPSGLRTEDPGETKIDQPRGRSFTTVTPVPP